MAMKPVQLVSAFALLLLSGPSVTQTSAAQPAVAWEQTRALPPSAAPARVELAPAARAFVSVEPGSVAI